MIAPHEIQRLIQENLPGSQVQVEDTMGTGDHFDVFVASPAFVGKTLIDQHKMVFAILKKEMNGDRIHAVQIKTKVLK